MEVVCENCGWQGDDDDDGFTRLSMCHGLDERLTPGQEVPAGQCPECQCFCYWPKELLVVDEARLPILSLLDDVESFVAGFEDDESQEGIGKMLDNIAAVRRLLRPPPTADDIIRSLVEWNSNNGHCVDGCWLDAIQHVKALKR